MVWLQRPVFELRRANRVAAALYAAELSIEPL
jgi:hypothetical protein